MAKKKCKHNSYRFDDGGIISSVLSMASNTLGQMPTNFYERAKGIDLTDPIKQANAYGSRAVEGSSDDLLKQWDEGPYTAPTLDDIYGGEELFTKDGKLTSKYLGKYLSEYKGADIFSILTGNVNNIANIIGINNTKKNLKEFTDTVNAANTRRSRAFSDAFSNAAKQQYTNMLANYSAFGGPIYGASYMSIGPSGYDIAKDNAYAKQMQVAAKNSTSFSPVFNAPTYEFAEGGGIHIAPSKKGTFTAAAKKHGKSVQAFASQVLANPENYSPAMRKKANFARNASKWHHADGGLLISDDFTNGVTMINQGGTHENNPHEGVQMGIAPDGKPNLVEEGEAIFNDYVFSNRLRVPKEVRNKYKLRGPKDMTFAEAFREAQKESKERPNDPISQDGLENIAMILARTQEAVRGYERSNKKSNGGHIYGYGEDGYYYEEPDNMEVKEPDVERDIRRFRRQQGPNNTSLSWLRYAEPLANFGAVFSDIMGWTNKPYTYDFVPEFLPISYNPIGNYIPETHFDTRYAANQAAQQAAATRNAIMQSTAPSRYANLLAADYNAQIANGQLLRDAAMQDYNMLLQREQFNRGTNEANSKMALEAAMANQKMRPHYAQLALQQAKMNVDEKNTSSAAKAQNIGNLAESIANIGREEDAKAWRDMLLEADVYGAQAVTNLRAAGWNDSRIRDYYKKKGLSDDDITALGIKACGGRIRKRKKGLTY